MIEARGLGYAVGGARLLNDVSVAIHPGEIVAVVGPNGAGKSTLLRALAGDLIPTTGAVRLLGRPLASFSAGALARQRAVLLQGSKVGFPFTVLEVVLMGWGLEPESAAGRALAARMLTRVGLPEAIATRIYPTLSGGEQQRVDLARTLVQMREARAEAPGFLLLDEPTASLDLAHESLVLELLRQEANSRRLGILLVLHDLTLAAWIADRVALLRHGSLVGFGPPHDVLTQGALEAAYEGPVSVTRHPQSGATIVLPGRLAAVPRAAGETCNDAGSEARSEEPGAAFPSPPLAPRDP